MEKLGSLLPERKEPKSSKIVSVNPSVKCQICLDTGWLYPIGEEGKPDYSNAVRCQCMKEQDEKTRRERYIRLCALPGGTEDMTFKNFKEYPDIKKAITAAHDIAKRKVKWLALLGGVDLGKTHLAIAICREWLAGGLPARYAYVPILLDELRRGFSNTGELSYESQFKFFCTVELLVLDDLGTESATPWVQEKLDTIVDYRLVHKLPLVITSNLAINELPIRIASRLQRFGEGRVVVLDGQEYRLRGKK
jgi:DNA replication protein DnaC